MQSLTAIILTFNEEKHIERCILNLKRIAAKILVIDSFSTDKTIELAHMLGATVYQNSWTNHSTQFNWALQNCNIVTDWTMRIDCDEYLSDELIAELHQKLPAASIETGGFIMKRRVMFMDRWIKHGGYYPTYLLRIWRTGTAYIENRWMDEHVVLEHGKTITLRNDLVDHNLNNLSWWIQKHNNYAIGEMKDILNIANGTISEKNIDGKLTKNQITRKRWFKENVYFYIPLFVRPLFYYLYRYIILLGFFDGLPGLIFHFLQGFWYRFLVDAKVYEFKNSERL
ncbi:glycosyltransferase family 2 protein [Desertivirga xinjiangensis]|uniref:glycosyltransferase family 2 protein n=1 Tax=Desertivirga xinjiangensis TaxID=539206 RepID=UPI00210A4E80|nr:glycosyltransferase family 2 protein [Pedobacter xinjiangensis]